RQQLPVPPHGFRTALNIFARQRPLDSVIVIDHFQWSEVELADMVGSERIFTAALAALQCPHVTFVFFYKSKCLFSCEQEAKISWLFSFSLDIHRGWNWHLVTLNPLGSV